MQPSILDRPANQQVLRSVRRALQRGRNFHWYAVRCPGGAAEAAFVDRLRAMAGQDGVPDISVVDVADDEDPLARLAVEDAVRVVTGLGARLRGEEGSRWAGELNLLRNELPELAPRGLVLVMPAAAMDRLLVGAPDLWSTRTAEWDVDLEPVEIRDDGPRYGAQASEQVDRLEAMLRRLVEAGGSGTAQLSVLARLANEYLRAYRWDDAVEAAKRGRELARHLGDERTAVAVSTSLVDALRSVGSLEEAVRVGHQAVGWARRQGEIEPLAGALVALGRVQFRRGENDGALVSFEEAEGLYARVGSDLGRANALLNRGNVQFHRGENDGALVSFEEAEGLYARVGDDLGRANALLNRGNVQFRRGEKDGALVSFEKAEGLYARVGDDLGRANALTERARLLASSGALDAAVGILDEVATIETRCQAWHNLRITRGMQAEYAGLAGRPEEAARFATEPDAEAPVPGTAPLTDPSDG